MKLKPETLQKIAIFKSKHHQLQKELFELQQLKEVQFDSYSLQNQKVLLDLKQKMKDFKPKKLDLVKVLSEIEQARQHEVVILIG